MGTFGLACTPISFFSQIVSLVPATTSGVFALIWPPFFYWKLLHMKHGSWREMLAPTKRKLEFALHMVIILISIVAIVFGVWGAIDGLIDKLNENNTPVVVTNSTKVSEVLPVGNSTSSGEYYFESH